MAVLAASAVLFVFLGVRLLLNRRKHAAATANTLAALTVLSIIGTLMLFGLSAHHIGYLVQLVILIAVTSYLDPSLAEERAAAQAAQDGQGAAPRRAAPGRRG